MTFGNFIQLTWRVEKEFHEMQVKFIKGTDKRKDKVIEKATMKRNIEQGYGDKNALLQWRTEDPGITKTMQA